MQICWYKTFYKFVYANKAINVPVLHQQLRKGACLPYPAHSPLQPLLLRLAIILLVTKVWLCHTHNFHYFFQCIHIPIWELYFHYAVMKYNTKCILVPPGAGICINLQSSRGYQYNYTAHISDVENEFLAAFERFVLAQSHEEAPASSTPEVSISLQKPGTSRQGDY